MESSRNSLDGAHSPKRAHSPNIMAHEPIFIGEKLKESRTDSSSEDDSFVILENEDVNDNIKHEEESTRELPSKKEMIVSQLALTTQLKAARYVQL